MSRPWTRSMPIPSEENYDAQPSNEFTQGQSSQPGNELALSQMCRLYEQSQQQHREIMNQVINMGNHHGQYQQHSKLSELQKTRPQTFSHTDKPLEASPRLQEVCLCKKMFGDVSSEAQIAWIAADTVHGDFPC